MGMDTYQQRNFEWTHVLKFTMYNFGQHSNNLIKIIGLYKGSRFPSKYNEIKKKHWVGLYMPGRFDIITYIVVELRLNERSM